MPNLRDRDNTKAIISFGFIAIFALMITVMWLSMTTLHSINNDMSLLIRDTAQKTSRAYQMRDVIRLRSTTVRSLLQISDPVEREILFEKLIASTKTYTENRSILIVLAANKRENEIFDKVELADNRVAEAYDKASDLIYNMVHLPDALKSVLGEVQLQELVLLNHLNDLVLLEKILAQEALGENQRIYKKTQQLLLGLVIAAFGLSLLISITVINRVTKANRRIAHLASHDDLTGLANRRSFEEQLKYTIGLAQRGSEHFGLLYIDLDRFKMVNDTCGHHAGDQLLIELTDMIKSRLRRGDIFARLGGDEFAIIAKADTFKAITQLAEDLRLIVSDYTFRYADQSFKISLSIGVLPITGDDVAIESILTDVDSACYVAKQSGRNRVHITQENDADVVKYRNDIAGIQSIRQALSEDRLALFYQPVFKIEKHSVHMAHCEILLRIRNENGELFSPANFIPIAEKYNIMTEIDRWVFSHVMDWLSTYQDQYKVPKLLINLSGLSFIDDDFLTFVDARLQSGDVDPSSIAFEITETAAVDNLDKANVFIDRIRQLGSQFALDDFGSGFSTFAYLKKLPIDYLKIDGSLVKNMSVDRVDHEMVKAINTIGHTVGATTIAEFVEDDKTLQLLREMGVDYAQGYGLCKPRALKELLIELEPRNIVLKKAS